MKSTFLESLRNKQNEKIAYARKSVAYWEQVDRRMAYKNANPYERMAMDKALF